MDTRSRTLTSTIVALCVAAVFVTAAPGRAQESDPADLDLRLRYVPAQSTPEAFPPRVPRECKPRYMAGPGTGLVLGIGSIGVGGSVIWAGTLLDPRLTAGGSFVVAAGLAVAIFSAIKVKRNRDRRARICGARDGSDGILVL